MKHKPILITGYFIVLTLLSVRNVQAQDTTKNITLKEAVDLSIKNSKLLKINKAKIDEATAVIKEANERKLPEFSISGSYHYLPVKPNIDLKSNSNGNGGGTPNVSQAIYGIANISLPVYTGGKIQYGIESAKYLEQATKLDAGNNRQDVIINTIKPFSNFYKAKAAVELVKQNLL